MIGYLEAAWLKRRRADFAARGATLVLVDPEDLAAGFDVVIGPTVIGRVQYGQVDAELARLDAAAVINRARHLSKHRKA